MSTLKKISFYTDSGGLQTLDVQTYEDRTDIDFYGDAYDVAIDGSIRSRVRGMQKSVSLQYEAVVDKALFRSLYNNIASDLMGGGDFVRYSEGASMSDTYRLVPTERMVAEMKHASQHGTFSPFLDFKSIDRNIDTITIKFDDYGYVFDPVAQAIDYGYITQPVTQEGDYGTI